MILPAILIAILLSACGTDELRTEVQTLVDSYNSEVTAYNEKIAPYNEAVVKIEEANSGLQETLDAAQEVINKGEEPYDQAAFESLKTALVEAGKAKVSTPQALKEVETLSVPEEAKKDALKTLKEQTASASEELKSKTVPEIPEVPDYSGVTTTVTDAQKVYENSIQSLKQITAPTDEFVKERLQRIETISAIESVTEDHDPNGLLNKQGGYIGCIYFTNTQVDRSDLYIEDGKDNIIDVGTDGGGAIEVFATAKEANVRNDYLASFDGGMFASGSHYVEGTCVIRTSNYLNGTQQKELTAKITEALITID